MAGPCLDRTTVSGAMGFVHCDPYDKHCHEWSLDIESGTYEDTNWPDWKIDTDWFGWRSYVPGLKGFSGSFSCYADELPSSSLMPGGYAEVFFYTLYDTDAGNYYGYHGCVLITAVHPAAPIDGMQTFDTDWQGSGPLTIGDIGLPTTTTTA